MTSFLTFSVTAVRISNDIPTQSDYLPLISVYMVLSMIYILLGMVFFILIELFSKKKKIPRVFLFIIINYLKLIKCNRKEKQAQVKNRNREIKNRENLEIKPEFDKIILENKTVTNEKVKTAAEEEKFKAKEFEEKILTLNFLFAIVLWLFVIIANTVVWLLISH